MVMLWHTDVNAVTLNFGADGIVFLWSSEDKIGLLTENSVQMRYSISSIAEDGHCATFSSPGWALKDDVTYYAYAPFNTQYSVRENRATALPVDFSVQQQTGNDNTDHLSQHAFYVGNVRVGETQTDAIIRLRPMTSVLRLSRHFDAEAEITQVQISVDDYLIPLLGTMNLVQESFTSMGNARVLTLSTSEMLVPADGEAIAYITLPACNLEGQQINVRFVDSKGNRYEDRVDGFDIQPGCTYCIGQEMEKSQPGEYTPQTPGTAEAPVVVVNDMPIVGSSLPTGIAAVPADRSSVMAYDLMGRRVAESYSGVKITNGVKILKR